MGLINAQKRTLDDLKERGITVYVDKGGRIRHSRMPIMNLPGVRIVDKSSLTEAREEERRLNVAFDWSANKLCKALDEAREEIKATREAYKVVMAEKCAGDEVHCTCVPFLRDEIETLREQRRIQEELISSNYEYIAMLHKERKDSLNIETMPCPTKPA